MHLLRVLPSLYLTLTQPEPHTLPQEGRKRAATPPPGPSRSLTARHTLIIGSSPHAGNQSTSTWRSAWSHTCPVLSFHTGRRRSFSASCEVPHRSGDTCTCRPRCACPAVAQRRSRRSGERERSLRRSGERERRLRRSGERERSRSRLSYNFEKSPKPASSSSLLARRPVPPRARLSGS